MSAPVHLIPTVEAFAEYVRREFGPDAVLHPANRRTYCSRVMDYQALRITEDPARVTCKVCAKKAAKS